MVNGEDDDDDTNGEDDEPTDDDESAEEETAEEEEAEEEEQTAEEEETEEEEQTAEEEETAEDEEQAAEEEETAEEEEAEEEAQAAEEEEAAEEDTEESLDAGEDLSHLPDVDDDVFASRDAWGAEEEDFEDDAGDWSSSDYHEVAATLFGEHEFFGDTAEARYISEGYSPVEDDHPFVAGVLSQVQEGAAISFFEKDGQIVPRGFLTSAALALLESTFPDLVLELHVTVPRRPLAVQESIAQPTLPDALRNMNAAEAVDLRKYASPIGDQGSTSRCAAFAWTHALEMLGNIQARPVPRLACSFTMYRFQQLQGDLKDFKWAWKGGDGTSGTWQPGRHLFTNGTCRHDLWHNDKKEPNASLEELEADARNHLMDADVYDVTVEEMKKCLSAGLPVQISMATGEAFQDIGRDGVMKAAEKPSGQHGYHAMLCVGYIGNFFIVKNSWGEDWGDSGYCYIPKKVLLESEPEAVAIVPRKPGAGAPPPPPTPVMHSGFSAGTTSSGNASAAAPPSTRGGTIPVPPPAPPPQAAQAAPAAQAATVACPHCARNVPHGRFCKECGAPLPVAGPPASVRHFCAKCGTPRAGVARFCAGCGAKHE